MKKNMMVLVLVLLIIICFRNLNVEASQLNLKEAESLKSLGLFMGTDNGFELEKVATRAESAAMLVRLLGVEKEAKENKYTHPFTDVPKWADQYIGYMYKHGLTSGISKNKFGSSEIIDGKSYATFVLRALGYDDSNGDFTWENALEFSKDIKILDNNELKLIKEQGFKRNELVLLSYNSLQTKLKNIDKTLMEHLISKGAVNQDLLENGSENSLNEEEKKLNAFINEYMEKLEKIPEEAITIVKAKSRRYNGDNLVPFIKINRELLPLSMKDFVDITTSGSALNDYNRMLKVDLGHTWKTHKGVFPTHNENIEEDMTEVLYDLIIMRLLSEDGKLLGFTLIQVDNR